MKNIKKPLRRVKKYSEVTMLLYYLILKLDYKESLNWECRLSIQKKGNHKILVSLKSISEYKCIIYFNKKTRNPAEICIIGDRAMTDVLLATINNAVGILTKPVEPDSDSFSIKFSRLVELSLISYFKNNTQKHPVYGDIS